MTSRRRVAAFIFLGAYACSRPDAPPVSTSSSSLSAEVTVWEERLPATAPDPRYNHTMVYDSANQRVVLFGGTAGGAPIDETWLWNGTTWSKSSPAASPSGRHSHAAAYDSIRQRVVMFGGYESYSVQTLGDTWEWNGTNWSLRAPETSPDGRNSHAMAYDNIRERVVLFGGWASEALDDTWEWDGFNWYLMNPESKPPARSEHSMVFDETSGHVMMFGGWATSSMDDTWEWDGTTWTQATPLSNPSELHAYEMAWNGTRERAVLFGGIGDSFGSGPLDETWEWDGEDWAQKSPLDSPPARQLHAMAYDAARHRVVLFGGFGESSSVLGDTWVYYGYGGPCSVTEECETGFCVDEVCCETTCGGGTPDDCVACSIAQGAATDGVCGTVVDDTPCTDGDACTLGENCQIGECTPTGAVDCSSPDACFADGTCDPDTGDCDYPVEPTGTECDDDNPCTETDVCDDGECAGAAVICTPGDCQESGVCVSEEGGCVYVPKANGTGCDDGLSCTETDTCEVGACAGADDDGDPDTCDDDGDDVEDSLDNCPSTANPSQEDSDDDGEGDACDEDSDSDGDGVSDMDDDCPTVSDPGQTDSDDDGVGDACDDDDIDEDGIPDHADNCATIANPDQSDSDDDGEGDACDLDSDSDGDGIPDAEDLCASTFDPDQADSDGDGYGDACDDDDDNDGIGDEDDFSGLHATGGSCTVAKGRSLAPLIFFVGIIIIPVARRRWLAKLLLALTHRPGILDGSCWLLLLAVLPGVARAEGLDAQILRPGFVGRGGISVETTDALFPLELQMAVILGYADSPVQLRDDNDLPVVDVLPTLSTMDLRLAIGITRNLEATALVPTILRREADFPESVEDSGIGDVGIAMKWRIKERGRSLGIALMPELLFPTGNSDKLVGDGGISGGLCALVDHRIGPVLVGSSLGARFRQGTRDFADAEYGQQLLYGLMVSRARPSGQGLHLAAEVHGAIALPGHHGSPAEGLVSVGYPIGPLMFVAGGGTGLDKSVGAPDWRVFMAVAFQYSRRKDTDGDGIVDNSDRCPTRPEDPNGYQDEDGCPEQEAAARLCPEEDLDGFQDEDGCLDEDNDADGILDALDRCPMEPETRNDFQDEDGCPDTAPKYVFKKGGRIVFNNILFKTGKYELLPESLPVLDEIVKSLEAQPHVRVRVEGHTDDRSDDNFNLTLSQQRALAVVNYLASKRIDSRRLEYTGYGETRPLVPNTSEETRAKNRRVEFLTLDAEPALTPAK